MKRKKVYYLQYAILISILGSIFILSSQTGQDSRSLSDHFIEVYKRCVVKLTFLEPSFQALLLNKSWHYVRKIAHVIVYMLLGGVIASILARTRIKVMLRIVLGLVLCTIYALTDEWHQYYVVGRGAQLRDIVIDSCGALIGIIVVTVIIGVIRLIIKLLKIKKTNNT